MCQQHRKWQKEKYEPIKSLSVHATHTAPKSKRMYVCTSTTTATTNVVHSFAFDVEEKRETKRNDRLAERRTEQTSRPLCMQPNSIVHIDSSRFVTFIRMAWTVSSLWFSFYLMFVRSFVCRCVCALSHLYASHMQLDTKCVCICSYIFISKHCGKRCRYYSVTVVKISHQTLSSRLLSLSVHFLPFACDFQTHIQILTFGYTHAHTFHIITSSSFFDLLVCQNSFYFLPQKKK